MLENITDAVLIAELKDLVKKDTRLTARLLVHLGEVDARKLHLTEGHPSMFVYCVQALAMDAATRRLVFARDGARCTFIGAGGHRCTETGFLELDHLVPWARGGANDGATLTLRCRSHNQHTAEIAYGKRFMDRKRRAQQSPETAPGR